MADTSNPPVQTQAGEPLFTPYATFSGGEVEFRPYDANPPINERYRSNPVCNGDLQTITITFRYPVSQLSFGVSTYDSYPFGSITIEDDKGHIVPVQVPYLTLQTINWQWNDIRVLKITGDSSWWWSAPHGKEMLIDNVRFRAAVDIAVLDPVPDLQTGNSVNTYPETLATGGRLVSAVSTDSANRVVLRMKSNFVGERLKITVVNDIGVPSTSVTEDGGVGPIGGAGSRCIN